MNPEKQSENIKKTRKRTVQEKEKISELCQQFIESIGLVAQGDGLQRIAGRLFGLMVFEKGPFSFSELAELLQVSRGSISSSARTLQSLGIIERVGKAGDRQDYYQLAENPYSMLFEGSARRAAKAKATIEKAASQVPAEEKDVRRRLDEYAAFYGSIEKHMQLAMKEIERSR